jgi:hypothetical protein
MKNGKRRYEKEKYVPYVVQRKHFDQTFFLKKFDGASP